MSFFIGRMMEKAFAFRGDGFPQLTYFTGEDFGAKTSSFSFLSGKNRLYGERYFYGPGPYKAVIVFFHGIGAGHRSYSQEISALAKEGYLVYAYDNTGSMMSEGKSLINLAQSALDQKAFFAFLDGEKQAQGLPRYCCGHSWGGYAALLSLLPEYRVAKTVSMAGFLTVPSILEYNAPILKKFKGATKAYLKRKFGVLGTMDLVEVINQTKAKVLYIQGDADKTCPNAICFDRLKAEAKNPNLRLMLVPNRGHQPYWTVESGKYFEEVFSKRKMASRNRDLGFEIDYARLNEDDPKVMKAIIDFFAE